MHSSLMTCLDWKLLFAIQFGSFPCGLVKIQLGWKYCHVKSKSTNWGGGFMGVYENEIVKSTNVANGSA
jgi:hypothetical protein